ncbi:MAG: cyclic nucleotide-binding domain-containing protein [Gammaproteobacteria bacterium]|jgi:signal-transduction protein with cAMP-binding, CBS, and nucleotidyltransferase domain
MHTVTVMDRRQDTKGLFELVHGEPEFNVLSEEEMDLLDRIMVVKTYSNGYRFRSDDNIYLLIDGDVTVIHKMMRSPIHYEHMHIGEFFDLFTLVGNRRHSAECFAVASVRAASLPRAVFEFIIRANIPLSYHFRQIITNQIRRYFPTPGS